MLKATKPPLPAFARENWAPDLGALAVCVYIAGLAVPFRSNLWLILLAAGALCTIFFNRLNQPFHSVPLLTPVLIFLAATALSTMRSEDPGRSLRLSAPLLPALLLFLVIADHFQGLRHTRHLYLAFSAAGLGISLEVLWSAWRRDWAIPPGWQNWMSDLRSPLLVVPNDTVFLAVVAPLSLALLFCAGKAGKVLSPTSILFSIVAVCLIRSRTATLTIIASLAAAAALARPRLAIVYGFAVTAVAVVLDASLGFPLVTKFDQLWNQKDFWNGRTPIWSAAWDGLSRHLFSVTDRILSTTSLLLRYIFGGRITYTWRYCTSKESSASLPLRSCSIRSFLLLALTTTGTYLRYGTCVQELMPHGSGSLLRPCSN